MKLWEGLISFIIRRGCLMEDKRGNKNRVNLGK